MDDGQAAGIDTVLGQTMAQLATRGRDPGNLVWVPGFKFPGSSQAMFNIPPNTL